MVKWGVQRVASEPPQAPGYYNCSVIKLNFLRNYTQGNNGYLRFKDKSY